MPKKNSINTHYLIEFVTWEEMAKESVRTRNSACAWFAVAEHTSVLVVMLSQAVGLPNMLTYTRLKASILNDSVLF
jgi:hypothetical protein